MVHTASCGCSSSVLLEAAALSVQRGSVSDQAELRGGKVTAANSASGSEFFLPPAASAAPPALGAPQWPLLPSLHLTACL